MGAEVVEDISRAFKKALISAWGYSPSGDAATQLTWLALRNIKSERGRNIRQWREATNPFAAMAYGDRSRRVAA